MRYPETLNESRAWWNNQIDTQDQDKTFPWWEQNIDDEEIDIERSSEYLSTEEEEQNRTIQPEDPEITGLITAMVESSSTTPLRETKKLKTPTPFSGKREDLQKFLQDVMIYVLAKTHIQTTWIKSSSSYLIWVKEMQTRGKNTAEQKVAEDNSALTLRTYNDLIKLTTKDFSPYDALKDAIYKMKELKLGNTSIEEHVAKFKMLVTKLKLEKNNAVIEYFWERRTIWPFQLCQPPLMIGTTGLLNSETTSYEWGVLLQNPKDEVEIRLKIPTRKQMRELLEGFTLTWTRKTQMPWM